MSDGYRQGVDFTDGGATIDIEIDGNTRILCKAKAGTDPTAPMWQICKIIQGQDATLGGYPYIRTLWGVLPSGVASSAPDHVASTIFTLPLQFK